MADDKLDLEALYRRVAARLTAHPHLRHYSAEMLGLVTERTLLNSLKTHGTDDKDRRLVRFIKLMADEHAPGGALAHISVEVVARILPDVQECIAGAIRDVTPARPASGG